MKGLNGTSLTLSGGVGLRFDYGIEGDKMKTYENGSVDWFIVLFIVELAVLFAGAFLVISGII